MENSKRLVPRYPVREVKISPDGELEVKSQSDYRIVPRSLLEHCLEVIEEMDRHYMPSMLFEKDIRLAISQLKANLAIGKPQLNAAKVVPEVLRCKICCAEKGQKHFLMCRETGIVQLHNCRWRYTEENCPGHSASWHDSKICGNCGIHINSLR